MRFAPKTDVEIASAEQRLLPPGTYDFEVIWGDDAPSKKGDDMITLDLMVFDAQGGKKKIRDWITANMFGKLKRACAAMGMQEAYEGGNLLADDFVGKSGKAKINIQKSEEFGENNRVQDYIAAPRPQKMTMGTPRQAPKMAALEDDEIPF